MNKSAYTVKLDGKGPGKIQHPNTRQSPTKPTVASPKSIQDHLQQQQLLPQLIQQTSSLNMTNLLTYSNINKLITNGGTTLAANKLPQAKLQKMRELKEQLQYQRLIKQNMKNKNLNLTKDVWHSKRSSIMNTIDSSLGMATKTEVE